MIYKVKQKGNNITKQSHFMAVHYQADGGKTWMNLLLAAILSNWSQYIGDLVTVWSIGWGGSGPIVW